MNIVVCISRVPDTATKINIGSDGKSIDTKGVKFVLNPYDDFAIEEALLLKKKFGGSVTVVNVGTDEGKETLRNGLAMGADKAVLIKGDNRPYDTFYNAKNFAEYAKSVSADLVITGKQTVDFDSQQLASLIGEFMELPSISVITKLEINENKIKAERDIEGGKEIVESELPCVLSAQKGLNTPRYPKLPDIMKAKKKPIEEIDAIATEDNLEIIGMEKPSRSRAGKVLSSSDADLDEIVKLLKEDAKVI